MFEHKMITGINFHDLENTMSYYGKMGWELVSVVKGPGIIQFYDLFFKRAK